MKRLEVVAPHSAEDDVKETISEYTEDITTSEVEKDDTQFTRFQFPIESDVIDDITEELKGITDLETGELTIDVLEQRAKIEKGKRHEGGSVALSVEEMYSKAFAFAQFSTSSWALIGLAAGIAVFGLVMENIMIVIGAMVIAPILGPFLALSFGLVVGDRKVIRQSAFHSGLSIVFAVIAAFFASLLISMLLPAEPNALMALVADPGFLTIPLSLLVGSAAALTFTTEHRESLAGVAVAIALVPPTAVAGMAIAMADATMFFDVSLVILSNVVSLILAGSVTFKLRGITPTTYYRKKVSEQQLRRVVVLSLATILALGAVVGYVSFTELQATNLENDVEDAVNAMSGDHVLMQEIDIEQETVTVTLAVVDPSYTADEIEEQLEILTDRTVDATLVTVDGTVE